MWWLVMSEPRLVRVQSLNLLTTHHGHWFPLMTHMFESRSMAEDGALRALESAWKFSH